MKAVNEIVTLNLYLCNIQRKKKWVLLAGDELPGKKRYQSCVSKLSAY